MNKMIFSLVLILVLLLVVGGWGAVGDALETLGTAFSAFATGINNYFESNASPYLIVKIIMCVASAFGIWFGVIGGKALYWSVAAVLGILGAAGIVAGL